MSKKADERRFGLPCQEFRSSTKLSPEISELLFGVKSRKRPRRLETKQNLRLQLERNCGKSEREIVREKTLSVLQMVMKQSGHNLDSIKTN